MVELAPQVAMNKVVLLVLNQVADWLVIAVTGRSLQEQLLEHSWSSTLLNFRMQKFIQIT